MELLYCVVNESVRNTLKRNARREKAWTHLVPITAVLDLIINIKIEFLIPLMPPRFARRVMHTRRTAACAETSRPS